MRPGIAPRDMSLVNPVHAIKEVSRDQTFQWIVELESGGTISAIDLQREYLDLAQKVLKGRDGRPRIGYWTRVGNRFLDDLENGSGTF